MKLLRHLLPVLAGLLVLPLPARTFTSADGTRTVDAELLDYRPSAGTVVLRHDGRNHATTARADAFSEEDREYFKEFLKDKSMRGSLHVTAREEEEKSKDDTGGIYTYSRLNAHYSVAIRNSGDIAVEGLTAKYDIYVQRFDKNGDRTVEVVTGETALDAIASNLDTIFTTSDVKLTLDCETSSSCPTCKAQAASVKRERLLGLRVRIYKGDDAMVTEFHSSTSIRSLAGKEDQARG